VKAPVLLAAAALAGAGHAVAAILPAGSVGPGSTSVAWQGQPYANSTPDPRFCTPQAADPGNILCDHFTLAVAEPGEITVTIGWPSAVNDLDLYVCLLDPDADLTVVDACTGGLELARSDTLSTSSETATFAAPFSGFYEIRVVPHDISTPTAYAGSATWAPPTAPPPAAPCSPPTIRIVVPGLADVCVGIGIGTGT
jgi:hypothetical protein